MIHIVGKAFFSLAFLILGTAMLVNEFMTIAEYAIVCAIIADMSVSGCNHD